MHSPTIIAIAAISENRGLGINGQLLFRIREDMKRFQHATTGHPVIMGRKTYESIGKPLPNRTNIIITHDNSFRAVGCVVVHSLDEAISKAREKEQHEIFIIGGGEIYRQALPIVDKLYLTIVEGKYEADAFFPEYSDFKIILNSENGQEGEYVYRFMTLVR